jgi:hypothetical protein
MKHYLSGHTEQKKTNLQSNPLLRHAKVVLHAGRLLVRFKLPHAMKRFRLLADLGVMECENLIRREIITPSMLL